MNSKSALCILPGLALTIVAAACSSGSAGLPSVLLSESPKEQTSKTAQPISQSDSESFRNAAKKSQVHEEKARELLLAGKLDEAEAEAQLALKAHPKFGKAGDPWMLELLAEVKLAQGKPKEAIELLRSTFGNGGSGALTVNLKLALAYLKAGDFASAAKFYRESDMRQYLGEQAVNALPNLKTPGGLEARTRMALACWHLGSGNDYRAEPHLREALRLAPGNPEIAYWSAKSFQSMGRTIEPLQLYRIAAKGSHGQEAAFMVSNLEDMKKRWPKEFYAQRDLRKEQIEARDQDRSKP